MIFSSSEREYEETGSEGEHQEEMEGEGEMEMGEEENAERIEEEQERGEDQEMMESHQRNHIGMYFWKSHPKKIKVNGNFV